MREAVAAAGLDASRVVEFEACANFRDIGGYEACDGRRVRWRRLYRSMTPEYMSEADMEKARGLGIGLVVDLRGPRFASSGPVGEAPARRESPGRRRVLVRNKREMAEYVKLAPEEALPRVLERMGGVYARAAA